MKLTAKVKLKPAPEQHQALLDTLETANQACNEISDVAWGAKVFNQFKLHNLVYHDIKDKFSLSAQVVVRCISKVSDAYKVDKKTKRTFGLRGAIAYDARILRWYVDSQEVSIWTTGGRKRIPFACGPRQLELLQNQRGESDLGLVNGEFYLFATCEVETPDPQDVKGVVGVDMGIVNIATDSDGNQYSGSKVTSLRKRRRRQRKRLQAKQTKSAKRRLKKLSGKEARFANDVNHCVSKQIVKLAQDTGRGIALEDLTSIRERVTVRKRQRDDLHSWAFYDLRDKVEYKARLSGVPFTLVDPRNTSRTCNVCGYVDKANRTSQDKFLCKMCGHADHADCNAAKNISVLGWAAINPPNVSAPLSGV